MTVAVEMSNGPGGPSPARGLGTTWAESKAKHEGKKKEAKKRKEKGLLSCRTDKPRIKGSVKSHQF